MTLPAFEQEPEKTPAEMFVSEFFNDDDRLFELENDMDDDSDGINDIVIISNNGDPS